MLWSSSAHSFPFVAFCSCCSLITWQENWGGRSDYSSSGNTGGAVTEEWVDKEENLSSCAAVRKGCTWQTSSHRMDRRKLWEYVCLLYPSGKDSRRRKGVHTTSYSSNQWMQSGQVAKDCSGLCLLWVNLWSLSKDAGESQAGVLKHLAWGPISGCTQSHLCSGNANSGLADFMSPSAQQERLRMCSCFP